MSRKRRTPLDRDEPLAVSYAEMEHEETPSEEERWARAQWEQLHHDAGVEPPAQDKYEPEPDVDANLDLIAQLMTPEEDQYMDEAFEYLRGNHDDPAALAMLRDRMRARNREMQQFLHARAPSPSVAYVLAHLAENPDLRVWEDVRLDKEPLWPGTETADATMSVHLRPADICACVTPHQALMMRVIHCTYHWEAYARAALRMGDEEKVHDLRATWSTTAAIK